MEAVPPWELKYIDLDNHDSFAELDPNHGVIGCANCHGGNPDAATVSEAHAADFLADPSADPVAGCGSTDCHPDIAESFSGSMHLNIWGERQQLADRSGHADFASCPADIQDAFNSECTSCHATCGDCHVSRPNSVGGGLVESHVFMPTPDREDNCQACHGSRVGADFNGIKDEDGNYLTEKDIHRWAGFQCIECHSGDEMHADATGMEGRYYMGELTPTCTDCHEQEDEEENLNLYHAEHWPGVIAEGNAVVSPEKRHDCFVCHSQEYNNCDACHVDGEWTTDPEYHERNPYLDFKIGYNVDQDANRKGKYVVVRHIPVARDSYAPWGLLELSAFDEIPNWKYTSPHNVRPWTRQTAGSVEEPSEAPTEDNCWLNCHLTGDNAEVNRALFLLQTDLDAEEYNDDPVANREVIVDTRLPDGWTIN